MNFSQGQKMHTATYHAIRRKSWLQLLQYFVQQVTTHTDIERQIDSSGLMCKSNNT